MAAPYSRERYVFPRCCYKNILEKTVGNKGGALLPQTCRDMTELWKILLAVNISKIIPQQNKKYLTNNFDFCQYYDRLEFSTVIIFILLNIFYILSDHLLMLFLDYFLTLFALLSTGVLICIYGTY